MRPGGTAVGAAVVLLWFAVTSVPRAQDVDETPEGLPQGSGRDETFYACTPCHSTRLVRNQALSRERWATTLDWMVERHGMPQLEDPERALVLDYLTTEFGPRAGAAPAAPFLRAPERKNPFATR